MRLSVVIPTLNEEAYLGEAISVLRARTFGPAVEVLVADCGSVDDTRGVAARCGVRTVTGASPANRAGACNAGAAAATGDAILFLHADSQVPAGFDTRIGDALASSDVVGGAFEFKLGGPQRRLRLVELINRARYRVRGRFFGDQGIFVRRRTFVEAGGFPPVGIFEDAHFCARLRHLGAMRLVPAAMVTSPRRFYNGGILRTLAADIGMVTADLAGLDLHRFAVAYARDNVRRGRRSVDPPRTGTSTSSLEVARKTFEPIAATTVPGRVRDP